MGEWIDVKFKDYAFFQEGPGLMSYLFREEGFPFMNIRCIENGKIIRENCQFIPEEIANGQYRHFQLDENDLIVSTSGTLGKKAFVRKEDLPLLLNTSIIRFRPKDETTIDRIFLNYILEDYSFLYDLKKQSTGSAQVNVGPSHLEKIWIRIPESKPEQTHIAEILSTADEAIAYSEALIAKYQRIKTGLMQDLLTKGIDENGNIRSKATHKFVVKNGIEVPEEWEVDTLGTLIKAVDAHPSHRTPPSIENGVPYLGISDIDDEGNVDLKKCRKVSYSVLAEHNNRYQIRDGDIIFGKIGTIGEPKRLKAWSNVTISANVILIQPHDTSDFIFWVLNSEYINNQVNNTIHSTSQPAFGMEKVRALTILIPPKNERETIQNILNQNESNILSTKRHHAKLQSIKTGLMQDLLSGKVRVKI